MLLYDCDVVFGSLALLAVSSSAGGDGEMLRLRLIGDEGEERADVVPGGAGSPAFVVERGDEAAVPTADGAAYSYMVGPLAKVWQVGPTTGTIARSCYMQSI